MFSFKLFILLYYTFIIPCWNFFFGIMNLLLISTRMYIYVLFILYKNIYVTSIKNNITFFTTVYRLHVLYKNKHKYKKVIHIYLSRYKQHTTANQRNTIYTTSAADSTVQLFHKTNMSQPDINLCKFKKLITTEVYLIKTIISMLSLCICIQNYSARIDLIYVLLYQL